MYITHEDLRAFFERLLQTVPVGQADYIWQRYLDFELHYGDLHSLQRLEKRRAEAIGDGSFAPACPPVCAHGKAC